MNTTAAQTHGHLPHIEIQADVRDAEQILTPDALAFLTALHARFVGERGELLAERMRRRVAVANGRDPRFMPETAWIRDDSTWRVAGAGPGLHDRRVEITAPTDRKATISALNSGAKVWVADLEDATSPTWDNIIGGQRSLYDTVRGVIEYTSPKVKEVTVRGQLPTIVMQPRGWHLVEKHLCFVDQGGRSVPASASLTDFGLYFWHNAQLLIQSGSGPYFSLPKLECHEEARLWNEIFTFAQDYVGMPRGTIRATVPIETIQAAFQMDEILYELRDHCAGLSVGGRNYISSIIKTFRSRGGRFVFPDRDQITMTTPFIRAYTELPTWSRRLRKSSTRCSGSARISSSAARTAFRSRPHSCWMSYRSVQRSRWPACGPTSRSQCATSKRGYAGTVP